MKIGISDALRSLIASLGWTVLRMGIGCGMCGHGYFLLFTRTTDGTTGVVGAIDAATQMGLPLPWLFGWAGACSEFFGGILLVLGLATRAAAFFVACTMTVASYYQSTSGWRGVEYPFLYVLPSVAFLTGGGGRFALDAVLFRQSKRD